VRTPGVASVPVHPVPRAFVGSRLRPVAAPAGAANDDLDAEPSAEWLDAAALGPEDIDEDALATAMAEDELGAITHEEMALLEAGLVFGDNPTEVDGEEPDR